MDQHHPAKTIYDRTAEDVGNIVEFGHVNVFIPDQQLATLFYVSVLGLTRDPFLMTSTDNMWINVGQQQIHMPTGGPQVLRGTTGIVIPDFAPLRQRIERNGPKLRGTAFTWAEQDGAIDLICPWGNRYRLHAPAEAFGPVALGIAYVEIDTPAGTAGGIARFYRDVLHGIAHVGHDSRGAFATVGAGMHTQLIYRETAGPMPPFDGHHIQITLADFSGPHERLLARGLVTEESDAHQYRFQALVDPEIGDVLVEIEHEVRSMRHPLYNRQLINRNPLQSNRHYAPGREAWPWSAPLD
jgi:catechol 2,3-dioxygenase-like lactoylglutathione lyase family enzyme